MSTEQKKLINGIRISPEIEDTINFWQDWNSRHKKIHISINGQETSLCNNAEYDETTCSAIEQMNSETKKLLCRNCGRIAGTLSPNQTRDHTVKEAKKTVSRQTKKTVKHKRLQGHQKALSKTREDFMKALEATPISTIEISEEQESLNEALSATNITLTTLRRCAIMNLDRIMNEWRKLEPRSPKEFILIQQSQKLKLLINAIDEIKSFPKQL